MVIANSQINQKEIGEVFGEYGVNDHLCYEWGLCNGEPAPTEHENWKYKGYYNGVLEGTDKALDNQTINQIMEDLLGASQIVTPLKKCYLWV